MIGNVSPVLGYKDSLQWTFILSLVDFDAPWTRNRLLRDGAAAGGSPRRWAPEQPVWRYWMIRKFVGGKGGVAPPVVKLGVPAS
jgi:hypothetical protein